MTILQRRKSSGFTLIEILVSLGIFCMIIVAIVGVYSALARTVKAAREKTVLSSLASQYLEIVRNLPFSQVGTVHGIPSGSLPDFSVPYAQVIEGTTYKVYYEVTWIDDPSDGTATGSGPNFDPNPTDYKQVKMDIVNTSTNVTTSYVTTVVPQGLEGASNSGVIWVKVFNAVGQPVAGANINIVGVTNGVNLNVQSDSTGQWVQVGLPAGVNQYHIVVTKSGYSTDQTYPITVQNPNPTKPDATTVVGQVTQVSFAIDSASNLTINTLDGTCQPLSGIGIETQGTKLKGTPNVLKYDQTATSGPVSYPNGQIVLNGIEWDTYTPLLSNATLQSWNIAGTSPIQQINILPGTNQTFTVILVPPSDNSLLVIVKDAATGAPLENANVELKSTTNDYTGLTGGSVWLQNDWSGNAGTAQWSTSTPADYWQASGGIVIGATNDVELQSISGGYLTGATSTFESSTFDTGTSASSYSTLTWQPLSQSASTTLVFQLAANNDNSTWNYVGPDGTANTYYTVPGGNISPALAGNRYVRYKAFLETDDATKTPVLSSIQINYVSGCFTPGQFLFNKVPQDTYTLTVGLSGYSSQSIQENVGGNGTETVLLGP